MDRASVFRCRARSVSKEEAMRERLRVGRLGKGRVGKGMDHTVGKGMDHTVGKGMYGP